MHYTTRFHRLQLLAKEQKCVLERNRRHGATYSLYSNKNGVEGHFENLDQVYLSLLGDKSFN
jgi:hypothetical protein